MEKGSLPHRRKATALEMRAQGLPPSATAGLSTCDTIIARHNGDRRFGQVVTCEVQSGHVWSSHFCLVTCYDVATRELLWVAEPILSGRRPGT
jgi:hypothetical protein